MCVDSRGFQVCQGEKHALAMIEKAQGMIWDTQPHFENFLAAVRSRKHGDLAGDILEGHLSTSMCHLANMSYRTGRALHFDDAAENFGAAAGANALLTRSYRPPYTIPDPL